MTERDKIVDKLKGIKALAERGIDGEKTAALNLLDKLMTKYNITDSDLEKEDTNLEFFKFENELHRKLISQIIYMILGDVEMYRQKYKYKQIAVYCTKAECLEIKICIEFYWRAFNEEMELFYFAFLEKNSLFPTPEKAGNVSEIKLSSNDMLKLNYLMEGMEKHIRRQALTGE